MAHRVLITTSKFRGHGDRARAFLAQHDCELLDHTACEPMDEGRLRELVPGADALIAGPEPVTARVIAAAPTLRAVNAPGVGFDHIDVAAASRRGIAVCTCAGANRYAVAELALGLMIALARDIPGVDRGVRAGGWPRRVGPELRGKTLGIVGTGQIGKALAGMARGLGMRLLATDAFPDAAFADAHDLTYVPLPELLAAADFVSLHCPLAPGTRGLIGPATLALMKPTAHLINTARGGLIDEAALLAALRAGRIAGAGLDVFEAEPQAARGPFAALDNVILSSHLGGATVEAVERSLEMALQNVTRVLRGERPLHRVN